MHEDYGIWVITEIYLFLNHHRGLDVARSALGLRGGLRFVCN